MRKLSKIFDSLQGSTHWRWWVEYYRYIGKSLLLSYNNDERSEKMDNKKVHKKIKWRKIKDAVVDKWLFVIMIIITFIFVISPYWLKWEVLENEVSYFYWRIALCVLYCVAGFVCRNANRRNTC